VTENVATGIKKRHWRHGLRQLICQYLPFLMVTGLITTFLFVYFIHRIVVNIGSGEAGVIYKRFSRGTVTDYVYPEGLYFVWPWDRMYVYDVRHQVIEHQFNALSIEGMPIAIDVAIRYRPEYELLGVLHQEVGPDYLKVIVIPEVEHSLRSVVSAHKASDIYTNLAALSHQIVAQAVEEAALRYVLIDDLLIAKVTLPKDVADAVNQKLQEEQQVAKYQYILAREKQEAERKRIEAEGIREYQRLVGETLSQEVLTEKGIAATLQLAQSQNSKVVVVGQGEKGLPLILGGGQ
jgi:regulator of protease activity HflC (stomatin/prohibitin superfamily)